jgi:hypothetical protein
MMTTLAIATGVMEITPRRRRRQAVVVRLRRRGEETRGDEMKGEELMVKPKSRAGPAKPG